VCKYKLISNHTDIKNVNSTKYLGVMIDNQLTWQNHIEYVYNKLLKLTSTFFYKIRDQVNMDVLKMIYFACVHSHLLYGNETYCNTYETYLSKLVILNNKLLRILQKNSQSEHLLEICIKHLIPYHYHSCMNIHCEAQKTHQNFFIITSTILDRF